ncbi:hypothetical protein M7I_5488 [Glarea lozoyensis 74030]|uniref:GPAT/DHAPAT C-terminal domain-containing protein n=1 Tax=Glarea lozoyensis (strain ATCC 74030 / MF5533) TaxID=1104152 RepID=H0ES14_GLAL7|nr:hypothetical protein M7I_5488 [Glarea lozoyensis 74030]
MTIHLFITEALVSAAMYSKVKRGGGPANQRITYTELRDQVLFLSQLFRGEFIYPTEGLATNLDNTLHAFEKDKIVDLHRDENGNITAIDLSNEERAAGRENFDFYCFLIWPFIESFWLGAVSLMGFTPPLNYTGDGWLDAKKCQDASQLLGKTLYHQGDLSYFEAVNKETLKNAWTRFEEESLLLVSKSRVTTSNAKPLPLAQLAPEWMPKRDPVIGIVPEGRLWDFTEKIALSRREGKNRRDGATRLFVEGGQEVGEEREGGSRRRQRKVALGARAHL